MCLSEVSYVNKLFRSFKYVSLFFCLPFLIAFRQFSLNALKRAKRWFPAVLGISKCQKNVEMFQEEGNRTREQESQFILTLVRQSCTTDTTGAQRDTFLCWEVFTGPFNAPAFLLTRGRKYLCILKTRELRRTLSS